MEKNFTQLFHKLQHENLRPEQLELIQQERTYLDKLKIQRIKIQQLTNKHQSLEKKLVQKDLEYRKLQQFFHEKCKKLEETILEWQEEKRKQDSVTKIREKNLIIQREKYSKQLSTLNQDIEYLNTKLREKDVSISTVRTEFERKISEIVQEHQWELKQLAFEYEKKCQNNHKLEVCERQLDQYKKLVQRQNKALKAQDQECQTLVSLNYKLEQEITQMEANNKLLSKQKSEYESEVVEYKQKIEELKREINKQRQSSQLHCQLEELRRKMGNMAKQEIEKIEELVNELK